MTFFQYVPFIGAILNFALAIFVLGSDRRSRLNQVFFAWALCITFWNFGTFALFRAQSIDEAYGWAKMMQFGVIFIPVTMLHLCLLLTGIRPGRWLFLIYLFHAGLAMMNCFDLFISSVRKFDYAYYSVAGPGFWIYTGAYSQSFASIILLWRKRRELAPRQRGRLNGILAAQTLLVCLGTNDILPIIGIDTYPIIDRPIVPYGSLAAVAYVVMVAYSAFQHQLLDVHLALGRSAAHVVRFLFLALIAVVLELSVATFAPAGELTTYAIISTICVVIVSALLASFLFPKLLGGSAENLERRLLGDKFEYQDRIREFTEQSRWETDMDGLFSKLHTLLVSTLRVRAYWIIVLDETNRAFTLTKAHPDQPRRQIPDLQVDSPVFQIFATRRHPYLSMNVDHARSGETVAVRRARKQLEQFVGDIVFPLYVDEQPLGLLILGNKTSGEPFTRTDTQLLVSLTENLALVLNQISLKNRLMLNQELDLLGRMSQGMAHDLNNLTTPIWTLLQLIAEGAPIEALRTELAPVATRNIQTMRAYIKEALFFSEHLRPDLQTARLDEIVRQTVALARANRRHGRSMEFTVNASEEVTVEVDAVLIQRLLTNLIANAIDASPDGAEIRVEVVRLAKTEAARDWTRVRVIDRGAGIRQEDIDRIFQPYFTTKKTGDEDRGFGLGLAICRKIATLHGGYLSVQSEVGKGTTVSLDLPSSSKPGIAAPLSPARPLLSADKATI